MNKLVVQHVCVQCKATFTRDRNRARRFCSHRCYTMNKRSDGYIDPKLFWARVNKNGPVPAHCPELGQCWLWIGAMADSGYGMISIGGGTFSAHRLAFQLVRGPIPETLWVLHRCDVRNCTNPAHLFLGDAAANARDMVEKKRHSFGDRHYSRTNPEKMARGARNGARLHPEKIPRGEQHWSRSKPNLIRRGEQIYAAKLTDEQVIEMRARRLSGERPVDLAPDYGVDRSTVSDICRRKSWRHLP